MLGQVRHVLGSAMDDLHLLEAQYANDVAQKGHFFAGGFDQGHLGLGQHDLER
jgi:hypothetical protein